MKSHVQDIISPFERSVNLKVLYPTLTPEKSAITVSFGVGTGAGFALFILTYFVTDVPTP